MMYAVVFYVTVLQLQISSAEIGSRGGRIFNNIINKNSTFNRHFKRPISRLIPLLDISREDRGEDNNAAKGKRSLETSHYAVAKVIDVQLYICCKRSLVVFLFSAICRKTIRRGGSGATDDIGVPLQPALESAPF